MAPDGASREISDRLAVLPPAGVPDWLLAPQVRAALDQLIETAIRHLDVVQRVALVSRRAHTESRELKADLQRLAGTGEVVARSPAMRDTLTRAEMVARHTTSVLILGESGSGKEVIARELHRRSPRANRSLVQINCGAIPDGLIDSELFGHERGAFTGADRTHPGVFERAHRGTLFLDEVGELSLPAQVKLLRVLQERQLRRVGGTRTIDVDVRLIAATNRSLEALVESGAFREDLYYRLAVFQLRVPPLRERREDLALLVRELTSQLATKLGHAPPRVTRADLSALEHHDWPGNVRELINVLEAAMILGEGRALQLPTLGALRLRRPPDAPHFEGAMRATIEDSLRATRGKVYGADGAAARLGLPPGTLQSKMKKLGIDRTRFT